MEGPKPKEQHERLLANVDRTAIVQHLSAGGDQDITRIAVALARQCDLFVQFRRLWALRVADLDQTLDGKTLSSELYMSHIFNNKRALYKELYGKAPK